MTRQMVFGDGVRASGDGESSPILGQRSDSTDHSKRVERSALWAAYGDALGWISELTDRRGLERRTAGRPLCQPIEWKRRIGGRAGVTANLPKGCYSDDSQLRLATGRSIRSDGFDVEAFSRVELPVWLSYALGGGKATSSGASNLARPRVQWFNNTYRGWTDSGGNGAAMRIQPHVWAARNLEDPTSFLPDVVRNSICTHSHPDGLLGAVIHAVTLAFAMNFGRFPTPGDLLATTEVAARVPDMVQEDVEVGQYWRSEFERTAGNFEEAWAQAVVSCRDAVQLAARTESATGEDRYRSIVNQLGLRDPARRGNGMLTAVASIGLTWCETNPELALKIAANALGTDTDTIASMAGAVLGAVSGEDPPVDVLDAALFQSEASRLSAISNGENTEEYQYPDLLYWSAPKTRADALISMDNEQLYVVGLGSAKALEKSIPSSVAGFEWQWIELDFGQTLFIKRRKSLAITYVRDKSLPVEEPEHTSRPKTGDLLQDSHVVQKEKDDVSIESSPSRTTPTSSSRIEDAQPDIEAMINYLEDHNYSDLDIGRAIRRVANKCTTGQIGAFLAILIDRIREIPSPPPKK